MICRNSLIKIPTLSQCNESSYFNDMYRDVENVDVSGGNFFTKSHTIYDADNSSYIDSIEKINENAPNVSDTEDTVLQDSFDIDAMFSASTIHQHANMELNNDPPPINSTGY